MADSVIKSVGRVFEVLEYFRECRRPVSVREIAAHGHYPLSSAAVLLKSMAALGYLDYNPRLKAYFPPVQTAVLGDWVLESTVTHSAVRELADEIHRQCDETVIVGVQNDVFVHYAYVGVSSHILHFFTPVGTRRTLCRSATGWAILSVKSDDAIEQLITRTLHRLGPTAQSAVLSEEYVFEQVEHVRKQGYAISRGMVTRGALALAMPLPESNTWGHFAIGIAGPMERVEPQVPSFIDLMRRTIADANLGSAN